jgi:6-phosphogluconate dehydrogenase
VEAGKEFGVETPIIAESLAVRVRSQDHPSYMGKILSALRAQFGGHSVTGA